MRVQLGSLTIHSIEFSRNTSAFLARKQNDEISAELWRLQQELAPQVERNLQHRKSLYAKVDAELACTEYDQPFKEHSLWTQYIEKACICKVCGLLECKHTKERRRAEREAVQEQKMRQ